MFFSKAKCDDYHITIILKFITDLYQTEITYNRIKILFVCCLKNGHIFGAFLCLFRFWTYGNRYIHNLAHIKYPRPNQDHKFDRKIISFPFPGQIYNRFFSLILQVIKFRIFYNFTYVDFILNEMLHALFFKMQPTIRFIT